MPVIQEGVFRGNRRICAGEGRWDRPHRGPHGENERLADPDIHGEDVDPSSSSRFGKARPDAVEAPCRHTRLCARRRSVWEIFRSLYQMTRKPIVIGGLMIFLGYAWS